MKVGPISAEEAAATVTQLVKDYQDGLYHAYELPLFVIECMAHSGDASLIDRVPPEIRPMIFDEFKKIGQEEAFVRWPVKSAHAIDLAPEVERAAGLLKAANILA